MNGDGFHDGHRVTSTQIERKFRILTVGDGDLTCSLALARAYGNRTTTLDLVASTLLSSKQELIKTYSNAANVLRELEERNVTVLYSVDATKLSDTLHNSNMNDDNNKWDAILFHHPHLGDGSLQVQNEQAHANRHYVLLAHYLFSAKLCLRDGGVVHMCLCGRQAQTWRVEQAAQRQGLVLQQTVSTTVPIHLWLSLQLEPAPVLPHYPAPRRFRNGKLGSKHFLGRFGYRHRRTHGDHHQAGDVNVAGSLHYVFEINQTWNMESTVEQTSETECTVCGMTFESAQELQQHCKAPALPDPVDGESHGSTKSVGNTSPFDPLGESVSAATSDNDFATSSIDNATPTNGPLNNEIDTNDNGLCSFLVKQEHDTKRLRWLLRQQVLGNNGHGLSKAKAERMIKAGRVALNGTIVVDSARLLHTGDRISLLQEPTTASGCFSEATTPLEVHYQSTNLVVVFKPVGMRTIGSFSSETLEMTVSAQMKEPFKALSKMDTGCSGLCVLQRRDAQADDFHISHVFTALVHGHVPESWNGLALVLPNKGRRQWRKDEEKRQGDDEHLDDTNKDLIEICVLETTDPMDGVSAPLSTVKIATSSNTSGLCNAICFLLRKHGHPVVNDRLCRREYLTLPRSIRNLIKNRLCIGCYEVNMWKEKDEESKNITVDLPDRLHATHWQSHHVKQNVLT